MAAGFLLLPLVLLAVVAAFVLFQYNRMVSLRNRCTESWSNVDTELLRRHDLVPNLVATVKASARHEQSTLAAVTEARAKAAQASRSDRAGPQQAPRRARPDRKSTRLNSSHG